MRLKRMDGATLQLLQIIAERNLGTLFQPLVHARDRKVFGHEALTRGPSDTWLHSPQNLFEAARRVQLRQELEFLCTELAATRFMNLRIPGRLFVNVSPDCIYSTPGFSQQFLATLAAGGLSPDRCVIELTEDCLLDDYAMLRDTLGELRHVGCEVAIDDLGAGSSGYRVWSELQPDYVKIDRYFISNIDNDATKLGFVRSMVDLGRTIGCRIIAEGVETPGECRQLMDLGIEHLQGYLFGRPDAVPAARLEELDSLDLGTLTHTALCAEHLAVHVPTLSPDMAVEELVQLLRSGTSRNMLAVTKDDKPIGVVRRNDLFSLLSKPFHPEVYLRQPVTSVMDRNVLMVESRLRLEQVSRLVIQASHPAWTDEFLVVSEGKYVGTAQTMDLLRHITEQQVQTARHANPLTLLPGNGPIKNCIQRLIADQRDFVVCYVDLDYFKPYNDVYGYAQGDRVIMHFAGTLRSAVADGLDFLGHVGGDDFVLVLRSPDWRERIRQVQQVFAATIGGFYSAEHLAAGSIIAADRDGESQRFPLLSVSAAALHSGTAGCSSADAVAQLLVEVKKQAKRRLGNSFMLRSEAGISDLLSDP
jgi:diguanylate cyclase (GGDEF)-like protein